MPDAVPYALQIECIDREMKYRRRVYPRRVEAGQMTQELADRELARMEAVRRTLELVEALDKDLDHAASLGEEPDVIVHGLPATADSITHLLDRLRYRAPEGQGQQRSLL